MIVLRQKIFSKVFYHNCDLSKLSNIKKNGLVPQVGNLTEGEVGSKEIPKLVYLGNKLMAGGTGSYRKKHGYSDNEGKTLKIEFTEEEYKNLHIVKNPECLGATNVEEYIKIRKKQDGGNGSEAEYRQRWKVINPPYTICVTDHITPDHIKNL